MKNFVPPTVEDLALELYRFGVTEDVVDLAQYLSDHYIMTPKQYVGTKTMTEEVRDRMLEGDRV